MKKILFGLLCGVVLISVYGCSTTKPAETQVQESSEGAIQTNLMETLAAGGADDKVPDPNAVPVEIVSIYLPNEDKTKLVKQMDEIAELDAQLIVNLLIENGILQDGTEVLSFEIEGDGGGEVGPGVSNSGLSSESEKIGVLNLSKKPIMADSNEALNLGAIANTFIENYNLDKLKLEVNGENVSGGDGYLIYYN